jgi:ligand-binding sensor domain-containing protein
LCPCNSNHLTVPDSARFGKNWAWPQLEDKKGNLWFGGSGLSRYDGVSFTRFTIKDGLINEDVWSILEDKTGNLWVGTGDTGLYLYDGKTVINYSEYKH